MSLPVPLHIRIPLEYAFSMVFALAIAWGYAAVAKADFILALGFGLLMTVGFYVVVYILARKARKAIVHPVSVALLALTAAFALGVIHL